MHRTLSKFKVGSVSISFSRAIAKSLILNVFCSTRPLPTPYRVLYFWFSLAFIMLRTCAVSLSIAGINDESKKPAHVLRAVPSHSWNKETERFLNDVVNEDLSLSGMRFFFITRKLMLTVSEICMTLCYKITFCFMFSR